MTFPLVLDSKTPWIAPSAPSSPTFIHLSYHLSSQVLPIVPAPLCTSAWLGAGPSLSSIRDYKTISSTFKPTSILTHFVRGALVALNPVVLGAIEGYQKHVQNVSKAYNAQTITAEQRDDMIADYSPFEDITASNLLTVDNLLLTLKQTAKAFFQTLLLRFTEKSLLTHLGGYSASGADTFNAYKFSSLSKLIKDPSLSLRRKVERKTSGLTIAYKMFFTYTKAKVLETTVGLIGEFTWMLGEEYLTFKYRVWVDENKKKKGGDVGPLPYGKDLAPTRKTYAILGLINIATQMQAQVRARFFTYFMSSACAAIVAGMTKSPTFMNLGAVLGDTLVGVVF
ncbi:hypothetical protein TrST_g11714 [Triparma strigata]|uniref:Uncharacterized protein n=1 Tax=Triparma strigata TaxID=1606541 RepID=A0A9W7AWW9_9STRA|nr:hypothetical protein TrST_g11714 [Triparma strigata]